MYRSARREDFNFLRKFETWGVNGPVEPVEIVAQSSVDQLVPA